METTYFDDRTRISTAAADRLHDEVRPATAAAARTEQLRGATREIPTPGVDIHGQQPWLAHAHPAGYRDTKQGWTPGMCSCGRRPMQWLDSRQGPKTVPYCGRPLSDHHGPEIEAAAWETPAPFKPATGDAQSLEDKTASADPEPTTLASWLADDVTESPQPRIERVGNLAGGGPAEQVSSPPADGDANPDETVAAGPTADGDVGRRRPRRGRGGRSTAERVAQVLARKPDATPAQVAARLGVSERTAQRNWPEQSRRSVNGRASLPDLAGLHAGHPMNGSDAGQEES